MELKINNAVQFEAIVEALSQFSDNERLHLEELDEEGEHDSAAWARLEAAESYLDSLNAMLGKLAG